MATKAAFRWNSGAGEQTLTGASAVCRFNGWKRDPHKVGEESVSVSTGAGYKYAHRTDYTAAMTLGTIAAADDAKVQDFLEWVNAFGAFAIDTADSEDNSYENCQIAPGTKADSAPTDAVTLDLGVSLTALNLDAITLRCIYS